MRMAALLLWLIVPVGAVAVYQLYGTPHLLWRYSYHETRPNSTLFEGRIYTSCTYLGWGPQEVTRPAKEGRCPFVRFFKPEAD